MYLTELKLGFGKVANLFLYLNYHPIDDFVVNLDNVWKFIGFSNKANGKRLLKQHFTENRDYKKLLIRTDEQKTAVIRTDDGKFSNETIMLNINTFKKLCLKSNTDNADKIHDYYIKLEMVYNELMKEQLEEQEKRIQLLENKPNIEGFSTKSGYIYLTKDNSSIGSYKIGLCENPDARLTTMNISSSQKSLEFVGVFKCNNMKSAEKIIHVILDPFRIKKRNEWFFFKNEIELNNAINVIVKCLEFIKQYRNHDDFIDNNEENNESSSVNENEISEKEKIGIYNGVFWDKKRKKWRSELVRDYKSYFLGYYTTELDGAKAYNDYASYLNKNHNLNYILNKIDDYIPNPRNIPDDNKNLVLEKKSSKYIGVHYDNTRQHFVTSMRFKLKHINLGHHTDELECAKMYNQQALYFNNNYDTNYALNDIENYITIEKNIYGELKSSLVDNKSSAYVGVVKRKNGKFNSQII